ncbi:hypothetical protein AYL99_11651 [Fonsecaea erecta]|uniref:Uncharacterized protein n=1 Tax=Fonsecaea erecta TaxID=1367422 RepID=A0A178Z3Q5_9EURO|nr:hypothetical protein AYL99_11651 [Fonsecaea erecta]OAP54116.1 hypothetical protein AYL99_11651 [Fonsecaea erecta]
MDSCSDNGQEPDAPGQTPGSLSVSGGDNVSSPDLPSPEYPSELQQLANFLRNQPPSDDQIIEFFLPAEQYRQLAELSPDGRFAGSRLRYDYSSATETLALRMPSRKHEYIIQFINDRLLCFLRDPAMVEYTATLRHFGCSDTPYPSKDVTKLITRQPDIQITNMKNPELPVLVCEVGYAQPIKKLHDLAREYIEQTGGRIRTVITLDLAYPRGKRAHLIVWRASFGDDGRFKEVVRGGIVEIRNRHGVKSPDRAAGLFLSPEDFGFTRGVEISADRHIFTVSLDDLYAAMKSMEENDALVKAANADWLKSLQAGAEGM